jgi:hypothetical protein
MDTYDSVYLGGDPIELGARPIDHRHIASRFTAGGSAQEARGEAGNASRRDGRLHIARAGQPVAGGL